jgi:hypothetical protein
MLVCHCNIITSQEIEDVILEFLAADPWEIIVPNKVYHAMEKRGRCCGCFPNVVDIIISVTENYHLQMGGDAARLNVLQAQLERLRRRHGRIGGRTDEGRTTGHRAA